MRQTRTGDFVSSNLRGCVYEICAFGSGESVRRAFQRRDFNTPALVAKFDPKRPQHTPQEIFTVFSKQVVDWKDREQAEDGLLALSSITEQVYELWAEDRYGDDEERWYGFRAHYRQLELACEEDGYRIYNGHIYADPDAHLDKLIELDLAALGYAEIVVIAQEKLNEAIAADPLSETVASKCKNLVEGICKYILAERDALDALSKPGKQPSLELLVKTTHKELGVGEAGNSAPAMKDIAAGLDKLGLGVAQARNRTTEDHAHNAPNPLKPEEVELTRAVVIAWSRFIIELYRQNDWARAPF